MFVEFLLHADGVVAIVNDPAQESDIVGIDGIHSVSVDDTPKVSTRSRCAINVNVLEQHALRADHGHGPHLGLHEAKTFNHGLFRIGYRDGVRSAMHV